mmetsp:Transcript_21905/g.32601  ORF Transcript_21905/g.32601 Transcript_21905/m.32601 type:complete len:81 (-) Transcript_21905:180-422(-)|eukprot:CAMPEP_0194034146 /NCGR_PEP_ID=MMETSP0009_2-20130614/6554_1 /TAXON_ID=210454 /ORGANISM="Grammatophora oceanica, Strain CCMP 410" /LENGTH=80 /DNA_ID=CAMNT_0038674933 /DNA_START=442 /DNA_END=684 /DNA_ORIENTATION=-
MGCGASKQGLSAVDDSMHVMLNKDKKKQQTGASNGGGASSTQGFVPRAEHPLMQPKKATAVTASEDDIAGGGTSTEMPAQ